MRLRRAGKRTEKIVGAAAVAVVLLSGSSYWVGSRVEQGFRERIDWVAEQGVTVSVVDYQRGVFGATARTDVILQIPSLEDPSVTESVTVPFIHSIRHGPFPALTASARIHSEAQLAEDGIAYLNEIFGTDPFEGKAPLVFDTVIGWAGGRHSRIVSPKFEALIKEDQTKVSWGGLNGEVVMDADLTHQEMRVVINSLSFIKNDDDFFRLGRVILEGNMTLAKGLGRVYSGTTGIMLDKFHMRGKSDNGALRSVEFENFRVTGDASVKDGTLNTEVRFNADRIITEGETKETADDLKLTFLLENIDAKAYDVILQTMHEDQTQEMTTVLQEQGVILLQRKPVLIIKDASGRWPEGVATGNFRIAFVGDANPENLSISSLSGNLQLELPRALVTRHISSQVFVEIADSLEDGEEHEVNVGNETTEQVSKQMAAMFEKGIFVEKGDTLTVDAHLQDGELKLNGKQQPIETLFELLPPFF